MLVCSAGRAPSEPQRLGQRGRPRMRAAPGMLPRTRTLQWRPGPQGPLSQRPQACRPLAPRQRPGRCRGRAEPQKRAWPAEMAGPEPRRRRGPGWTKPRAPHWRLQSRQTRVQRPQRRAQTTHRPQRARVSLAWHPSMALRTQRQRLARSAARKLQAWLARPATETHQRVRRQSWRAGSGAWRPRFRPQR